MRAMKDSGIEWIGKIPENWGISPLRSKFSFGKGLSITKADLCEEGVPVISYGQIHSKDNSGVSAHESLIRHLPKDHENLSPTSLALKGDFIFADTSEDLQGCGNCVYIDKEYPIYAGYHTLIVHPKDEQTGKFYAYLFTCDAWRAQVRANVSGVKLYSITQDILRRTYLLDPPTDEQAKIVQYLDKKCTDIDSLIKAKEKSNALLKERRQSIIYEAVTKGLDPTVPMKDSGVEWIGEIPEGWNVSRLKRVATIVTGNTPSKASGDLNYSDDGLIWIKPDNLKGQKPTIETDEHLSDEGRKLARIVPANTPMVCCIGTIGKVGYSDNEAAFNQQINAICFTDLVDKRFGLYLLMSQEEQQKCYSNGNVLKILNSETQGNLFIAFPHKATQIAIADYLDKQCSTIDSLCSRNDEAIDKLKEYRQSLIYEAVTGKMEVSDEVY